MIRIICSESDSTAAAFDAGLVRQTHKTFDVDLPEIEEWLRNKRNTYVERSVVGIEVIDGESKPAVGA